MIRHIFIVTYGRTGSTVLMNVLNAIEGAAILGENFNHLYRLWRVLDGLDSWKSHAGDTGPTHPFFGASVFPFDARREAVLRLVRTFFDVAPPTAQAEIRGLKEVRYVLPDFHDYIDFLDESFERSLFVCLTRNTAQCARSGFYKDYREPDVVALLDKADRDFSALAARKPASVLGLDYGDLLPGSARLEARFTPIGRAPDPEVLAQRLGEPSSYDRRSWLPFAEGSSIRIDQPILEEVGLLLKIDPYKDRPVQLQNETLGGVCLSLDGRQIQSVSLFVGGDRLEAELNLPSGGLARQRPDLAGGGTARFRLPLSVPLGTGSHAILVRRDDVDIEVGSFSVIGRVPTTR